MEDVDRDYVQNDHGELDSLATIKITLENALK